MNYLIITLRFCYIDIASMEEKCFGGKIVYSIPIEKTNIGLGELKPLYVNIYLYNFCNYL